MGVWIETVKSQSADPLAWVTPYMGVWIETVNSMGLTLSWLSHPTWVCGLKLQMTWEDVIRGQVTPYMGVWLETVQIDKRE